MADDFEEDSVSDATPSQDGAPDAERDLLPEWYREIFPAGPRDGFYEKLGAHALIHIARAPDCLVVTFDNLSDAGYPGYDIRPWAEKFIREQGWSHLGIVAQGPTWYRDAQLIARMEALRDAGFFARYSRVVMAGASMGGFGALAFADLAPGCDVIAFSPQSTLNADLVPWERRFDKGRAQDWSVPRSDSALTVGQAGRVWVVYDPFLKPDLDQIARLPQDKTVHLKAFGQGHKTALVLRRMDLLKSVMLEAVEGRLTPQWFYKATRARKDIYLYRKVMEEHLVARGKAHRVERMVQAFRARRQSQAAQAPQPATEPPPPEPDRPRESTPLRLSGAQRRAAPIASASLGSGRKPRTLGNVWQLEQHDESLRYLSDQYGDRVMGFEERAGVTLAQTPQVALGMVSFGGATAIPRPLPERFDYHLRDELLGQDIAPFGAEAQGVFALSMARNMRHALRSVIALSHGQPGIVAAESAPGSELIHGLMDRITTARDTLLDWGKILFVDRISLDLLTGSPDLSELEAARHYLAAITALKREVALAAGQDSLPIAVISQKPGGRWDGRSEVILAEGRLDIHEPALGLRVATPTYMLRFMPETAATLAPQDRFWVDEMEALAVDAALNGQAWFCPSLRQVFMQGSELVAEFATMGPLEFDSSMPAGRHGFTLHGCENAVQITGLRLDVPRPGSQRVILTLDGLPEGGAPTLSYAWGATRRNAQDEAPANHGALRERWHRDSLLQPGRSLHRYALSGRLPIMPSDLSEAAA